MSSGVLILNAFPKRYPEEFQEKLKSLGNSLTRGTRYDQIYLIGQEKDVFDCRKTIEDQHSSLKGRVTVVYPRSEGYFKMRKVAEYILISTQKYYEHEVNALEKHFLRKSKCVKVELP